MRCGLRKYIQRTALSAGKGGADDAEAAVTAAREAMQRQAPLFFPCFAFYSSLNGFCGVIGLNNFIQFVEDCQLTDNASQHTRKSDVDRLVSGAAGDRRPRTQLPGRSHVPLLVWRCV